MAIVALPQKNNMDDLLKIFLMYMAQTQGTEATKGAAARSIVEQVGTQQPVTEADIPQFAQELGIGEKVAKSAMKKTVAPTTIEKENLPSAGPRFDVTGRFPTTFTSPEDADVKVSKAGLPEFATESLRTSYTLPTAAERLGAARKKELEAHTSEIVPEAEAKIKAEEITLPRKTALKEAEKKAEYESVKKLSKLKAEADKATFEAEKALQRDIEAWKTETGVKVEEIKVKGPITKAALEKTQADKIESEAKANQANATAAYLNNVKGNETREKNVTMAYNAALRQHEILVKQFDPIINVRGRGANNEEVVKQRPYEYRTSEGKKEVDALHQQMKQAGANVIRRDSTDWKGLTTTTFTLAAPKPEDIVSKHMESTSTTTKGATTQPVPSTPAEKKAVADKISLKPSIFSPRAGLTYDTFGDVLKIHGAGGQKQVIGRIQGQEIRRVGSQDIHFVKVNDEWMMMK